MTSVEGFWGGPRIDSLEAEVRALRAEVKALRERGVRDAGALTIKNPGGFVTLQSGPSATIQDPTGAPQWVTVLRDTNGVPRYALYDPFPLLDGYIQALWMWDHLNKIVMTTDRLGGWAEPWFPIVMYQKFQMPTGVFQYSNLATNVAEQVLWAGEISYVTHPQVGITGVWGQASGSNTTRYRLKIWGTTVGTWDVGGLAVDTRGPFLIDPAWMNNRSAPIELTAQTLSGSGNYACQVIGCHMRQS